MRHPAAADSTRALTNTGDETRSDRAHPPGPGFDYLVDDLWESGDLQLDVTRVVPHYTVPPHVHDRHLVAVTVAGCFWNRVRGTELITPPGSVFVLPAGEPHHTRCAPDTMVFSIELGPEWLQKLLPDDRARREGPFAPGVLPVGRGTAIAGRLFREFKRLSRAANHWAPNALPTDDDILSTETLLLELLQSLQSRRGDTSSRVTARRERTPPAPRWLLRAREMVADQAPSTVRLADIAREVGVHPVHLSRTFRRCYGETMAEFLADRRIIAAQTALLTTHMKVSAIAHATGFCDHAHLTRVMQRRLGTTPSALRKAFARTGHDRRGSPSVVHVSRNTTGWSPASRYGIAAL